MQLTLARIARLLGQPLENPSALFAGSDPEAVPTGAAMDSRRVEPGQLFFCLPGERADGHDFAQDAVKAGASAVLAARNPFAGETPPAPLFLVSDTVTALGRIAAAHRDTAEGTVIGITGTAGKTSVKEALATVLAQRSAVARNPLNMNNQIGLPFSMLNASEKAAFWVMEAGISHPHDMDELGALLRPDLALILNVGPGHTEFLGDKGVASYKARLLAYLRKGGTAVINADYPDLVREAEPYGRNTLFFSTHNGRAPYTATFLDAAGETRGIFRIITPQGEVTAKAPFQGELGAENTAAIAAVAGVLGLSPRETAAGLELARPPAQRNNAVRLGRFTLIDDSYNANPLSMKRMAANAAALARAKNEPLLLVLGAMGELGPEEDTLHRDIAAYIATLAPTLVTWKGPKAEIIEQTLRAASAACPFASAETGEEALAAIRQTGVKSGIILVKGSRSNGLDAFVETFRKQLGESDA